MSLQATLTKKMFKPIGDINNEIQNPTHLNHRSLIEDPLDKKIIGLPSESSEIDSPFAEIPKKALEIQSLSKTLDISQKIILKPNSSNEHNKKIDVKTVGSLMISIDNHFHQNLKNLIFFLIFRIVAPNVLFCAICIGFTFLQLYADDYCFYPSVCECKNVLIYSYTLFTEFRHVNMIMMFFPYYISIYVTKDFYKVKKMKFLLVASLFITMIL